MSELTPFSYEQSRHLAEVRMTMAECSPLLERKRDLVGGMQWKTIAGKDYLYRYDPDPVTRRKRSTSLGRRSPETEAIYHAFLAGRERVNTALDRLAPVVEMQKRVSAALRLGDLGKPAFSVTEALADAGVMALAPLAGGVAMHAYQYGAGQHADLALPDTIGLFVPTQQLQELVELVAATLQDVDSSYVFLPGTLAFSADRGPDVSIIASTSLRAEFERLDVDNDIAEIIEDLWLCQIEGLVFSRSGQALPVSVVDPRALAMTTVIESMDCGDDGARQSHLRRLAQTLVAFAECMNLEFDPRLQELLSEFGGITLSEDGADGFLRI